MFLGGTLKTITTPQHSTDPLIFSAQHSVLIQQTKLREVLRDSLPLWYYYEENLGM